jgi:tRNA modification GTPase
MIFALATPVGKSAIAVIRVAGEGCHKKINASLDRPINNFGQVFLRDLRSREGVLDSCMLVFYKGPKSYCGEDMVEIFSHGGLGVVRGIVGFLEQLGMREAEPGEFTRLSVANNKMSLNEAEMVSAVIDSVDEYEIMLGVAAISGVLSDRVVQIGDSIGLLRVELESQIDFSDEDGVNEENVDRLGAMCNDIIKQLGNLRSNSRLVDDVGEKKSVLLVGPPNSGKSSLFNSMLGRARSITSDIAGTTRDIIEGEMVFNSNKFSLFDSAGIRDTNDEIESSGISMVLQEAKNQSLVLVVVDSTCLDFIAVSKKILKDVPHIIILNKSDLGDYDSHPDVNFIVSAKTGFGVSELVKRVVELINSVNQNREHLFLVNSRQAKLIDETAACCMNCLEKISIEDFELAAEELKQSRAHLYDFIGSKSSDDLLGDIFANFCIGK